MIEKKKGWLNIIRANQTGHRNQFVAIQRHSGQTKLLGTSTHKKLPIYK